MRESSRVLRITSTFVSEPVEPSLRFLFEKLELDFDVEFAGFNQVFQEALHPESGSHQNQDGINAFLVRASDLLSDSTDLAAAKKFSDAIRTLSNQSPTPIRILFCPGSEDLEANHDWEKTVKDQLSSLAKVSVSLSEEICSDYPVSNPFDKEAEDSASIPFSEEMFAAIGLCLAREVTSAVRKPAKLIVLDADNTLWSGVAGEDGPGGLDLGGPWRSLQKFFAKRYDEGMLLAISSKNNEVDLENVFLERADDLVLRKEHFVSWKANWNPKSENIRQLAEELNLGIDSFVFIDDNPAEIAEVTANCPGITAICLPSESETIPRFLENLWCLDSRGKTEEDRLRTAFYQSEGKRREIRDTAADFQTFLKELNLRIDIEPADDSDSARISQLSIRTNQFNANPERLDEAEVKSRIHAGAECHTVTVSDRFGDYGLVGTFLCETNGNHLKASLFLLSCRAMGKSVEREMIRSLGTLARERNCESIEIAFQDSGKNEPCRLFLESIGAERKDEDGVYRLSCHDAASLSQFPETNSLAVRSSQSGKTQPARPAVSRWNAEALTRIAAEWSQPRTLASLLSSQRSPRPELSEAFLKPGTNLEREIAAIWEDVLQIEGIGVSDPFVSLGGSSLAMAKLHAELERKLDVKFALSELFTLPTVRAIAQAIEKQAEKSSGSPTASTQASLRERDSGEQSDQVAIVGMSLRIPGADSPDELWENLAEGRESISHFKKEELAYPEEFEHPDFVPAKGIIDNIDMFDAGFFGILPNDAKIMDPQQRIFLELAWEALEKAGYQPDNHREKIGVYAGAYFDTYLLANLCSDQKFLHDLIPQIQVGSLQTELGNDKDYLATRVAFKLNLRGPAMTLQTACSTSMVAIAEACRSIREGLCDMALAGGVTVTLPYKRGYFYTEQGMLSGDGHCRTFDEKASGTVFANGAGVVVLKRLSDAIRDRDHIHAVIRGTGMNNDGGVKHSYTAPSVDGQVDVIRMAHEDAGITPDTVTAIEAHGTATPMGDPIEVTALTKAFREAGAVENQYCAIGSLKSNVGHLDVASGVCGVIKTALSLEKKALPPLLHFQKANPKIDFENSPFFPNAGFRQWDRLNETTPRRAGVSSFGVGGTNVHAVLEEAPEVASKPSKRDGQLLVVSARTETALDAACRNLAEFAASPPEGATLEDTAWTLGIGRKPFRMRKAFVASDFPELCETLSRPGPVGQAERSNPPVNFMFPGQGSQHIRMAADFYHSEPRFRKLLDRCSRLLEPSLGLSLTEALFPEEESDEENAADLLENTTLAQPAIFVIEYALADLWRHWGVEPKAMIGHSVGEFVAACHAGVFSLEEGLELLARRGRLMGELPGGGMLSVRLDEASLIARLPDSIDLAAVNSPELCVVAGPREELESFAEKLGREDIVAKPLHTSHAFHSRMMDPVVQKFQECIEKIELQSPAIPILSTVTGGWLTESEATDPGYWAAHLRETVRFGEAIAALGEQEDSQIFIEVGPGQTLVGLARQSLSREDQHRCVSTCLHVQEEGSDQVHLLKSLGRLWMDGVEIDWEAFYGDELRKRLPLPTYPFERKRHWVEPTTENASPTPLTGTPEMTKTFLETDTSPTEPAMSTEVASRNDALSTAVREILTNLSGIPEEELIGSSTYLELGFDSLLLTQVSKALNDEFGTNVKMRELMTGLSTIDSMVAHLDEILPKEAYREAMTSVAEVAPATESAQQHVVALELPAAPTTAAPAAPVIPTAPAFVSAASTAPAPVPVPDGSIQSIIAQQMALMQQQLNLLQGGSTAPATQVHSAQPPIATGTASKRPVNPAPQETGEKPEEAAPASSAPTTRIDRDADETLTPAQQRHLDELIAKYTSKTETSKSLTDQYRQWYADPRTVSGFNRLWKEMIYQIIVKKSKGSRLLDIDGNEYIDMLNGFGPGFLGHSPDRITAALHAQLDRGVEVGPQSHDAMEAAKLFCELTGNERCSFVNTGSEAVQAAMRMTRTVTGRDKIVVFTKDYHGNFDEVLVRGIGSGDKLRSMPVAPGIPNRAVDDVIVLEYGSDEALEVIEKRGSEIAAVIIEPIQSRRPEFQPREFIHEVRRITTETGSAFVFDEVITGFRTGPRGAQEYFGVDADVATYGKVVGAGMPVGVVAGKAEFMDTFDGGQWQYGDDSFPEQGVTFFAGTFVRHPLAMAAVKEMLLYLKECGPELWVDLKNKANRLSTTVNDLFVENDIPFRMPNFGSQMFVRQIDDNKYANLLFFHLREKGVFLLEGFPSYMTTAHTDEDVDYVIDAFRESVAEMQDAGFFPKGAAGSAVKLNGKRLTGPNPILALPPTETESTLQKKTEPETPRIYPLTGPLAEIWLACSEGTDANLCFNEVVELELSGPLDASALEGALQDVVDRHDGLRARFLPEGDGFWIAPEERFKLPVADLSENAPDSLEQEYEKILSRERTTPFDLENGPLLRAALVKRSQDRHTLILNAQHLACDGWSYNVLTGDLGKLYSARVQGTPLSLEPAARFGLHALESVEEERKRAGSETEKFWLSQFEDPVPILSLPNDGKGESYQSDRISELVEGELLDSVRETARSSGVTTFALMLGAFHILLGRLGRQTRVSTLFPIAGQNLGENIDTMIGHCVNFLPAIGDVAPQQSLPDFLRKSQDALLDCLDHQDYSYGALIEALPVSKRPKVEAVFNLEKMEGHTEFAGLSETISEARREFAYNPLFLNALEREDAIDLQMTFRTALFSRETVQSWVDAYLAILESIVQKPEATVGEIGSGIRNEDFDALCRWNDTATDYPRESSIGELFEEVAGEYPDSVAVVSPAGSISYSELLENSKKTAQWLHEKGIGKGDRVGILLGSSAERIAAILAAIRLGAAYVPLDPGYPGERLSLMLQDSRASLVISDDSLREKLPDSIAQVVNIDDGLSDGKADKAPTLFAEISANDPVVILYTSGSTGTPKGAVLPHQSVVRLVKNTNFQDFGPDTSMLQSASISFDASLLELFAPLLNGGKTVLPAGNELSLDEISESIIEHNINTLWLTSGLFQLMVEERLDALKHVRNLLTGGDVLSIPHAKKLCETHPDVQLMNGYGPTESATFVTFHPVKEEDLVRTTVPIGRPVANSTVWILDEERRPVPPGVPGELYCGGDGLALEYLNQPDLTKRHFMEVKLGDQNEERLYRTGDLCRLGGDGNVEFLGRIDHQVKIRGFRVEPGEIEAQLSSNPHVGKCRVLSRGTGAADKSLVAYVSPVNGYSPKPEELRDFLKGSLPPYMVPSFFHVLDELPLNTNGKIDSSALPDNSDSSNLAEETENLTGPPESDMEIALAAHWRELLKVHDIDRSSHFFELGGHSLLGMKLFAKLQSEYGLKVPLSALINTPTLGQLAAYLEERLTEQTEETPDETNGYLSLAGEKAPAVSETTVILQPEGMEPPLFGIHGGDGGVFFYQNLAGQLDKTRPFCAFEAAVLTDGGEIDEEPVEATASRYVEELRKIQASGPYHLCGYSFGGVVAYEMACQLADEGEEIAFVGLIDTHNPGVDARTLSLSERVAANWNSPDRPEANVANKVARLGKRVGTGIRNRIRFSTEGAIAKALPTSKSMGWLRQTQIRQAYEKAMTEYSPPRFEGSVTLFRALKDNDKHDVGPYYGWDKVVDGEVEIYDIPGNHITLLHSENIGDVAKAIQSALDSIETGV